MSTADEEIVGLYQRHGRAWAMDRDRTLFEKAWLDRFLALLAVEPAVLDLGCGCAEPIGRYLVEKGCRVTGLDTSTELIALCRERFADQIWRIGDMRTLALGHTFNGILAWDSFFHLNPDHQREMFPLFRQHASPRAALIFTSGTTHGVAMGSYRGEPLYHASLDTDEYRLLLNNNGFEVIAHVAEDATCAHRTIWLSQLR